MNDLKRHAVFHSLDGNYANTPKQVVIFEGPDGGGKTTLAKRYARDTRSIYVHFSAFDLVGPAMARLHIESMLPALLGYQSVVIDRSWISERVYAPVCRPGTERITRLGERMLDRVALRAGAVVVMCLPSYDTVRTTWAARVDSELLKKEAQLSQIYQGYADYACGLPMIRMDYTRAKAYDLMLEAILLSSSPHLWCEPSVGHIAAEVCVVGQTPEPAMYDAWHRFPLTDCGTGSYTLPAQITAGLEVVNVPEYKLIWADHKLSRPWLDHYQGHIVAIGAEAAKSIADIPKKIHYAAADQPYYAAGLIKALLDS